MLIQKLSELGYQYEPSNPDITFENATFASATKVGNLIYTSGQISKLGDTEIKGKVGSDIDIETAQKAAEICAYNCLRAAGSVVDIESITKVVKVLGMVNVADGFNQTSEVINGCTNFLHGVFGKDERHARSAVGMIIPGNWAVEIEMIFTIE